MGNLQVKNIPDELQNRLLRQARKRNATLDEVVLEALERVMNRVEFHEWVEEKTSVKLSSDPSEYLTRKPSSRAD